MKKKKRNVHYTVRRQREIQSAYLEHRHELRFFLQQLPQQAAVAAAEYHYLLAGVVFLATLHQCLCVYKICLGHVYGREYLRINNGE